MLTLTARELATLAALDTSLDTSLEDGVGDGVDTTVDLMPGYEASKHQKTGGYLTDFSALARIMPLDTLASLLVSFRPTWTALTLDGVWTAYGSGNYDTPGVYMDLLGNIHLRGVVAGGTQLTSVATLPEAFWPEGNRLINTTGVIGGAVVACQLYVQASNGTITVSTVPAGTYTYLNLDNLTFRLD